jgi:alkylation response protein AidB-like acyl-CoA dehydrogenase
MNQIVQNSQRRGAYKTLLTDELLDAFGERAASYDRENRFFYEDLEDLKRLGYLSLAVPHELGGKGFILPEVVSEQARLAYRAPSTALAINMHLYWTGAAAYLWRKGDNSLEWILKEDLRCWPWRAWQRPRARLLRGDR